MEAYAVASDALSIADYKEKHLKLSQSNNNRHAQRF
jgi:hypothetical protein